MQEEEGLQLQLIETTAASSTPLNRYCFFDGSTLIYLAGAHIVMVFNHLDSITFFKTLNSSWSVYLMVRCKLCLSKPRLRLA
jgi:hypothetical protein